MKNLFFFFFFFAFSHLHAQIIFQEDFDGVGGSTAGGAGTYMFPSGWLLVNVDNLTPASSVAYVNEAWERREDFANNVTDSCAFSTSWYSPAGTADDWMWTPPIGPLPVNCRLKWNGVAYDVSYLDGYEVRIMTVAPTGSTGVIGNMVTNSTVLYSTTAESNSWTAHEVSLGSYAGQTVYIGFRNNSYDKFLLLIDDIVVEAIVNNDIAISATDAGPQYTMIPEMLADTVCIPGATIVNNGLMTAHNVSLQVDITNDLGTIVYADTAVADSLTSGSTVHLATDAFINPAAGIYNVHYKAVMDETDAQVSNDSIAKYCVEITDSVYARDNGIVSGSLGIGAGNGGYIGQDFHIPVTTAITSVRMDFFRGYSGKQLGAAIWNMNAGVPDSIVATTDTLFYIDDSARTYIVPVHSPTGSIILTPGDYAVTAIEFDSTLALINCPDIFTAGHVWVNWPTIPTGTWTNIETFGANISHPFMLRLNVGDICSSFSGTAASTAATCATCADGTATASVAGGLAPYTYAWSSGDTTATATGLITGNYGVTVTDSLGCTIELSTFVSFTDGVDESVVSISVYPNPSDGSFTINAVDLNAQQAVIRISDITGRVVYSGVMNNDKFEVSGLSQGVYNLVIEVNGRTDVSKIVVE
ncbi:hypothetical protein SDC9_52671 [bioreactor metagenome]|uniref:Secretion system C-terminal sorting domain-containing protein n=1 Tax=bioreactor metagenome TaxID=1076179 RepID=A0A644WRK2_9ZZZZ